MKVNSIPAGLPINEASRLLAFLKVKYQPGYFLKSEIKNLSRAFGKDSRTIQKLMQSLTNEGLIGQDHKAFYLRSWRHITMKKGFNLQSFEVSIKDIRQKEIFEPRLFSAKVTGIEKAIRRGARVRERGYTFTDQIAPSTGLLSKLCNISTGKVSNLKRLASSHGFLKIEKVYQDFGKGTTHDALILRRETPGVFSKNGALKRRKADRLTGAILTYRIRNRKPNKTN